MELSLDTLYYTLSAIPQVLAATIAVMSAFMFFRLSRIHKFLVGDGFAVYNRKDERVYAEVLGPKYEMRLYDAISRESIAEIKEILKLLSDSEENQNISLATRPTGLQYVYKQRFCPTELLYNRLLIFTVILLSISVLSIILSILLLSLVDVIICSDYLNFYFFGAVLMSIISLVASVGLVIYCLTAKTIYEDRKKRDRIVKANKEGEQTPLT